MAHIEIAAVVEVKMRHMYLLKIDNSHRSKSNAEKYVASILSDLGWPIPKRKDDFHEITIGSGKNTIKYCFEKEVEKAKENGIPGIIQQMNDMQDSYLCGSIPLGASCTGKGIGIKIKSEFRGQSYELNAPGTLEAPEISLANDILFYRKSAVGNSDDLSNINRCYRGYLQSCISLIDCFLFKYLCTAKSLITDTETYQNLKTLDSKGRIEDRIEAWILTFATHHLSDYKSGHEWKEFKEIKKERNSLVHPVSEIIPYGLDRMVEIFNSVQNGIGGLLKAFRSYSENKRKIGFVERLFTAPKIYRT